MKRILTTLVGIPVLIYIIRFTPDTVCVTIVFAAMLLAMREYFGLMQDQIPTALRAAGVMVASVILFSFYDSALPLSLFLPASAVLILMVALFSRGELAGIFRASAVTLFGAWYVGGLMGYLVGVRRIHASGQTGVDLLMLLFVIIWANDIFAYLVGKSIGRHKLAPVVSPKKTVEGAIGGWFFGILAALGYRILFIPQLSVMHSAILAGWIGVMGQIGDLCESMLKRSANVKDSGAILPGHGGMLDRVDSLLFGAPAMYYYFYLILNR